MLKERKNNIYQSFKLYLYFIALAFTIANLGGKFLGIPSVVFLILFAGSTFWLFFKVLYTPLDRRSTYFLILLFFSGVFNVIYSIDPWHTMLYWFLYMLLLVSFLKVILKLDRNSFVDLLKTLPVLFFLASTLLYLILFNNLDQEVSTKNSLGMFSGALVLTSLNINSNKRRLFLVLIGFFILFESDSRSAIVYTIMIAFLYVLSIIKSLKIYQIFLLVLSGLIFSGAVIKIVSSKIVAKDIRAVNSSDALNTAIDERQLLLEHGWALFLEKPFFGYGLDAEYETLMYDSSQGLHVHNGYLETLIQAGLVISIPLFWLILNFMITLARNWASNGIKMNTYVLLILFGFGRAYGESYLFFNIGNLFSVVFIFLFFISFIRKDLIFISNR